MKRTLHERYVCERLRRKLDEYDSYYDRYHSNSWKHQHSADGRWEGRRLDREEADDSDLMYQVRKNQRREEQLLAYLNKVMTGMPGFEKILGVSMYSMYGIEGIPGFRMELRPHRASPKYGEGIDIEFWIDCHGRYKTLHNIHYEMEVNKKRDYDPEIDGDSLPMVEDLYKKLNKLVDDSNVTSKGQPDVELIKGGYDWRKFKNTLARIRKTVEGNEEPLAELADFVKNYVFSKD